MTSAFSWQNSISLCPALFCTPRPNFPVAPGVFLDFLLCIPVPYNEKNILFGCYLIGLVGLHRSIQQLLLQHYWLGQIGLGYHDVEWFALETNREHSVIFEIASKYCIFDFFC